MNFIEEIKQLLNIKGGYFIDLTLEDYTKDINDTQQVDFFKALSGDEFAYKTGMDRVAIVSKAFNERKQALLSENVSSKAYDFHLKLYSLKSHLPDDLSNVDFSTIKNKDESYFTSFELILLEKLGGGNFIKIQDTESPYNTVKKIEREMEKINNAVANKEVVGFYSKKALGSYRE